MGPLGIQSLPATVKLILMAKKGYFTLHKASECEPQHRMRYSLISGTLVFLNLSRYSVFIQTTQG